MLYTQRGILNDNDDIERFIGIEAGLAWLHFAEAVVVYIDHGISAGMLKAIHRARELGIRVEPRSLYRSLNGWGEDWAKQYDL